MKEVPVYLFLGFLESGKTKFIQETFEDPRFDSGERTLLLVCEEGETEYDPKRLAEIVKSSRAERVVVEWNGMRETSVLFDAMPDGWMLAQVMTFFDASTFLTYNQNMRQLVFDKVQYADMVVFNRFRETDSQEEYHKIVRAISRRPDIVYEYEDGRAVYDEILDPLPFDIDAKVIEISDRDYAFFYRDLVEETPKYAGKIVRFKGIVAVDKKLKANTVVVGRHIMTCCEADIAYSGLVCIYAGNLPLKTRDWVTVTARIDLEYHKVYGQEGPVLKATALDYTQPPEEEIATFY